MSTQPQRSFQPSPEQSFRMPVSMARHNSMLTPAELRLSVMVFAEPNRPITDEVWAESSGLDPRMKMLAVKGLRPKGLSVQGKGKKATYRFDTGQWETYWRSRPRRERARTIGRAPTVQAKPGMQVHPECRERCQRLCEPPKADVISISSATENAKPVSQSPPVSPPASPPQNAKPVSQTSPQDDVITTPLGNSIPAEHAAEIGKALRRADRRITTAGNPKALEAYIITQETAKLAASTKTQTKPKPRGSVSATAKADQLRTARDVLENPDGHSKLEIEIAREIVAGSGQ
jgi:hypothetical protein